MLSMQQSVLPEYQILFSRRSRSQDTLTSRILPLPVGSHSTMNYSPVILPDMQNTNVLPGISRRSCHQHSPLRISKSPEHLNCGRVFSRDRIRDCPGNPESPLFHRSQFADLTQCYQGCKCVSVGTPATVRYFRGHEEKHREPE